MINTLEKILEGIENLNYHPEGMGCGIEDCGITDRYEACEYGWNEAIEAVVEVIEIIRSHMDEVNNNGWIPVSERLPEEDDLRFYMCVLENHEEDLPMFCQYNEMYGFGFWSDIYDPISLGFIDTEFSSMDELGYEKVVAWRPIPEPYRTTEE